MILKTKNKIDIKKIDLKCPQRNVLQMHLLRSVFIESTITDNSCEFSFSIGQLR